jgi:hypothetical protein
LPAHHIEEEKTEMTEAILDVVPENPEVEHVAEKCTHPACRNRLVTRVGVLKAAGTTPYVLTRLWSSPGVIRNS